MSQYRQSQRVIHGRLESLMQNEVFLEKDTGIVNSIYHGEQTEDMINGAAKAAIPLIGECRKLGKKALILINLTDILGQTAAGRKAALDQINSLDFDKMAIFGGVVFIKIIIKFLITSSGKREKIKYFEDEATARKWLLE